MTYPEYAKMAEAAGKPHATCHRCGSDNGLALVLMDATSANWAKIVCLDCGGLHVDWARKPANLTKTNRKHSGANLLDVIRTQYADGEPLYCLICLRDERYLTNTWMEAHHILNHSDSGSDLAENLMPLCRECHQLVTWRRASLKKEEGSKP